MFLHAWRLTLPHPTEPGQLRLESPLPPDLAAFIKKLDAAESSDAER
jgi:23S rRNA pseudouridine955/2504/2580 synthase